MKTIKKKLSEMVLDFSIYPRVSVDSQHIAYMREAEDAGSALPPVIIEAGTNRVVDGFHRVKMWRGKYGDDHAVECLVKKYTSDKELLLDSIRYNAGHGRTLSRYDRTHCITLADKLHVPEDELASALAITVDGIGKLRTERIGQLHVGETITNVPLKRTIQHMAGHRLTRHQQEVNQQLGGMNQLFYVNQLIILIESGLLNRGDEKLMSRLQDLAKLLITMRKKGLTAVS